MGKTSIENQIKNLVEKLNRYNMHYHSLNKSLVSDEEYDLLLARLKQLEAEYPEYLQYNSPTQQVGHKTVNNLKNQKHVYPMLSLNNIFSATEGVSSVKHQQLLAFLNRISKELSINRDEIEIVASPKYDGVAVSLIYQYGQLIRAITRGDGKTGEIITHNIQTINNIPKQLTDNNIIKMQYFEVRGEVIIFKKDFEDYNVQHNSQYANARNLASGSVRQLNSAIAATRPLRFFAYSLHIEQNITSIQLEFYHAELQLLKQLGFAVDNNIKTLTGVNDIIEYFENMQKIRLQLLFNIDGIVYKINSIAQQKKLGFIATAPRFAIAHKFTTIKMQATILDIQDQIGRTGILTPVAKITPIAIDGVVVSSVTLHNYEEIIKKDLRIGDVVMVHRAGDVIPQIISNFPEQRTDKVIIKNIPQYCPVCNSLLIKEKEGYTSLRCLNITNCQSQKIYKIIHFVSKNAMNIKGLGKKNIEQLVDKNIIQDIDDIYKINKQSLLSLEHFADKKANNILKQINNSKSISLARFIFGLGIAHVGISTADNLSQHFVDINKLRTANLEQLLTVKDIGHITAVSIMNYFIENNNLIDSLLNLGLNIQQNLHLSTISNNMLFKKNIVFTGSFVNYTRQELTQILQLQGAKVSNHLSKNTDILLVGDKPGGKLNQALALSITIFTLDDIKTLLI